MAESKLPAEDKGRLQREAVELLVKGWPIEDICKTLKVDEAALVRWARKEPEFSGAVHSGVQARALLERARNLEELRRIRDESENDNSRLAAIRELDARAGAVLRPNEAGSHTVVIMGQTVNVGEIRGNELEDVLKRAAAKLGPEATKIVDAELAGNAQEPDRGGERGGADEVGGGTDADRASEASD